MKQEIGASYHISYLDEDGDEITVRSADDLGISLADNISVFTVTIPSTESHPCGEKKTQPPSLPSASSRTAEESSETTVERDKEVYDDDAEEIEEDKEEDNGEPPSKVKRAELKATKLQDICAKLNKKHEKAFGVPCNYSTSTKGKEMYILCPFCDTFLKVTKVFESQVIQKFEKHQERLCHKSNVYAVTPRASLNTEKFSDVELAETTSRSLIQSVAPGEFEVISESGKSFARCLLCGPSAKRIALIPKGTDFKTCIMTHLVSKPHLSAKKTKQSRMTSFFPRSLSSNTTAQSESHQ